MAMLRACYKSKMRLFNDRPDILVPGKWMWCPPGAKMIPYFHVFGTYLADDSTYVMDPPLGEVPHSDGFYNGKADPRYLGQNWCGNEAVWTGGVPYAQRGTPPVDEEGVPLCCDALPIVPGGEMVGGEALWSYVDSGELDGSTVPLVIPPPKTGELDGSQVPLYLFVSTGELDGSEVPLVLPPPLTGELDGSQVPLYTFLLATGELDAGVVPIGSELVSSGELDADKVTLLLVQAGELDGSNIPLILTTPASGELDGSPQPGVHALTLTGELDGSIVVVAQVKGGEVGGGGVTDISFPIAGGEVDGSAVTYLLVAGGELDGGGVPLFASNYVGGEIDGSAVPGVLLPVAGGDIETGSTTLSLATKAGEVDSYPIGIPVSPMGEVDTDVSKVETTVASGELDEAGENAEPPHIITPCTPASMRSTLQVNISSSCGGLSGSATIVYNPSTDHWEGFYFTTDGSHTLVQITFFCGTDAGVRKWAGEVIVGGEFAGGFGTIVSSNPLLYSQTHVGPYNPPFFLCFVDMLVQWVGDGTGELDGCDVPGMTHPGELDAGQVLLTLAPPKSGELDGGQVPLNVIQLKTGELDAGQVLVTLAAPKTGELDAGQVLLRLTSPATGELDAGQVLLRLTSPATGELDAGQVLLRLTSPATGELDAGQVGPATLVMSGEKSGSSAEDVFVPCSNTILPPLLKVRVVNAGSCGALAGLYDALFDGFSNWVLSIPTMGGPNLAVNFTCVHTGTGNFWEVLAADFTYFEQHYGVTTSISPLIVDFPLFGPGYAVCAGQFRITVYEP